MTRPTASPARVLFLAEDVTLAHLTRPLALARDLAGSYQVHLACSDAGRVWLEAEPDIRWQRMDRLSPPVFRRRLAQGRRLYDDDTLDAYLRADLELYRRLRPDLVVSDFRVSASVSARLAGIPLITLSNLYWSPFARQALPVPDHPTVRLMGRSLAQFGFGFVSPFIFGHHLRPYNRLRARHGLARLDSLQAAYTDGDYTVYLDLPEWVPTAQMPSGHRCVGPVHWAPEAERLPAWWPEALEDGPLAYVCMGSSGDTGTLPRLVSVLHEQGLGVLLATAGRPCGLRDDNRLWRADYLPGDRACQVSELVVCNGGSPSVYQALAAGRPVLGVASNLDQQLNMQAVEAHGAGTRVHAAVAGRVVLARALEELRRESRYRVSAQALAARISEWDGRVRFRELLSVII